MLLMQLSPKLTPKFTVKFIHLYVCQCFVQHSRFAFTSTASKHMHCSFLFLAYFLVIFVFFRSKILFNPLNPELNPICYLLALLGAHHFLRVSRIKVKSLTLRLLMSYIYIYIYIYGAPILDVSRSHTTTQHSR